MEKKLIVACVLFLILICGGGVYFYQKISGSDSVSNENNHPVENSPFIPEGEKKITLYHKKESNGTHTYSGYLALPTPCEEIETTFLVEKRLPENVIIDVTTKSGSDFCAQVISKKMFSVSFSASEGHTVSLRINSTLLDTVIVEGELPTQDENNTLPIELE